MNYSFNIEIATKYGVTEAIIIENIAFWTRKNMANGTNEHDGRYWIYNSVKAWGELFPFWGSKSIVNALKRLETKGIISTGNYNKSAYDRTKWYSLDESFYSQYYSITPKGQMEKTKKANGFAEKTNGFVEKGEPIPVINTVVDTDINTININDQIETLYEAYPRKVGKINAFSAIEKALKTNSFDKLLEAVKKYSKSRETEDPQYTKHPASWFNGGHWDDDIDPKDKPQTINGHQIVVPGVTGVEAGDYKIVTQGY